MNATKITGSRRNNKRLRRRRHSTLQSDSEFKHCQNTQIKRNEHHDEETTVIRRDDDMDIKISQTKQQHRQQQ